MSRRTVILSALLSWLTGCRKKAAPRPQGPGVSAVLHYPVLLANERKLVVKDDEASLTSTTVASGLNFPEFKLIDSSSMQYSIKAVTRFGQRSVFSDMGTTPFWVFLEMKADGKVSLAQAKALVLAGVTDGAEMAGRRVGEAQSLGELIEVCRKAWEWK